MSIKKYPRLILASASPRRSALLSQIGLTFEIFPSEIVEPTPDADSTPEKVTQRLAKLKARVVAERYTDGVVIGADTLVLHKKELLGKPKNKADAKSMLSRLSGKCHKVITGVSLINVKKQTETNWAETTKVYFRKLCSAEIENYIQSGETIDKAGAYGIQGRGAAFVKRIDGCYFNVVGLPLASLIEKLSDSIS